jgi:hypothetical protein
LTVAALVVVGCQPLFGIEDGTLRTGEASGDAGTGGTGEASAGAMRPGRASPEEVLASDSQAA